MSAAPFDWTEFEAEFENSSSKHIQFTPVPRLRARRRSWLQGSGRQRRLECQRRCGWSEDPRARQCPTLPRTALGSALRARTRTRVVSATFVTFGRQPGTPRHREHCEHS